MNYPACPLCEENNSKIISHKDRKGNALETLCCLNCGLVFNNPVPSDQEQADFYRKQYRKVYKNTEAPRLKHHHRYGTRVLQQIAQNPSPYRSALRILDIGADSGEFSALMAAIGKDIEAIEPTRSYANYVHKTFGIPVFNGCLADFNSPGDFDLIRINHVLEHMPDPLTSLIRIRQLLSDDGVLHVEVPDFVEYCRTKSAGNLFHYGHIYNFDNSTLKQLAARAGFYAVSEVSDTSIYFRKHEPFLLQPDIANATRNLDMLEQNRKQTQLSRGVQKCFTKLGSALQEQCTTLRYRTPDAILARQANTLREILGVAP